MRGVALSSVLAPDRPAARGRYRLPPARGPISLAVREMLLAPPPPSPGLLTGPDLLRLWDGGQEPEPGAWWAGGEDRALALVLLERAALRELVGVSPDWSEAPLLHATRDVLATGLHRAVGGPGSASETAEVGSLGPVSLGPGPLEPDPRGHGASASGRVRPCAVLRRGLDEVLTRCRRPALLGPPTEISAEQLHDVVVLTCLQWRGEQRLRPVVMASGASGASGAPGASGMPGAPTPGAAPETLADEPWADEPRVDEPRADDAEADDLSDVLGALPEVALWRLAMADHLASAADPARVATAVGWLVAADALLAARRGPDGALLRSHGLPGDVATAWDEALAERTNLTSLAAAERMLERAPARADQVLAGVHAALCSAEALETALVSSWRQGHRALVWPCAEHETPQPRGLASARGTR